MCLALGIAPSASAADLPPDPFVDHGACPFECCTYRNWTTTAPIDLFDRPNGRKIGKIQSGRSVVGLTGDVISHPIRLRAVRRYDDAAIRKGDIFYALHYKGEGYWAVWHNGKVRQAQFFGDEINDPRAQLGAEGQKDHSIWWVKIRTKAGLTGWAISYDNFANQDACG
jgi:hypothetical protein